MTRVVIGGIGGPHEKAVLININHPPGILTRKPNFDKSYQSKGQLNDLCKDMWIEREIGEMACAKMAGPNESRAAER